MDVSKLAVMLSCLVNLTTTMAEPDTQGLVPNMELLNAKIAKMEERNAEQDAKLASIEEQNWKINNMNIKLEKQNFQLGQEITRIQNQLTSKVEAFDCYRTSSLYTSSIITWDACSVLTIAGIAGNSLDGTFQAPKDGIYRFTFTGDVGLPSTETDPWGFVFLKVDGTTVASAILDPNYVQDGSYTSIMITMNTLQQLEAGQVVYVEWYGINGAYLYSSGNKYVHFTGQLLSTSEVTPTPAPEPDFKCPEADGWFEDPANCIKYYRCDSFVADRRTCENGGMTQLHWSQENTWCDYPSNVDCGDRPICDENDGNCVGEPNGFWTE